MQGGAERLTSRMRGHDPSGEFIKQTLQWLPFIPNDDQREALVRLAAFVLSKDERSVFILRGYAGTGKTNLISAVTKSLPSIRWRSVLLAPTGRAAKVLSSYSQRPAFTIHKKIFWKQNDSNGGMSFTLAENLHRNTLFIVDEASMIGADTGESLFNSLLENLFEYVYSGDNCKLILVGDTAQLPPVGSNESPALNPSYLKNAFYLNLHQVELREVARQKLESGILWNATMIRNSMFHESFVFPRLKSFPDVARIGGEELADVLQSSISEHGEENVIIITRSNKRATMFNRSYRNIIRLYEEDLCTGDRLMVVKNNYFWLPENSGAAGFIANGDMAEITRINRRESIYGFSFCDCSLRFSDYPDLPDQEVKIITDSLYSDNPSLTAEEQKALYSAVLADVQNEPTKSARAAYLRKPIF
jgi:exodeoxyribonuclease V